MDGLIAAGTRIGAYRLGEPIGRGGMGSVYRAKHDELGGDYAIKVLNVQGAAMRTRFRLEARVQSRIHHPNVVRVHDVLEHAERPALVMDLVDGGNLQDFLGRRGHLRPLQIDALVRGILRGVRAAHAQHIVHRDLKPLNVLLQRYDDDVVPRLTDFGLAKLLQTAGGGTRAGQVFGSPHYMSPEQFVESRSVDERSDLFALGCILYELVTQQRAFPGDDVAAVRNAIFDGRYRPILELRRDCPERWCRAIEGCLQVDAHKRYRDCDTLEEIWSGTHEVAVWNTHSLDLLGVDRIGRPRQRRFPPVAAVAKLFDSFSEFLPTVVARDFDEQPLTEVLVAPTPDPPGSSKGSEAKAWRRRRQLLRGRLMLATVALMSLSAALAVLVVGIALGAMWAPLQEQSPQIADDEPELPRKPIRFVVPAKVEGVTFQDPDL